MRRGFAHLTGPAACCSLMAAASLAQATPALDARAVLSGNALSLRSEMPIAVGTPCRTYMQWGVRDRVALAAPGEQDHPPVWGVIFESPVYTYDRCTRPTRVIGQPFATITRSRPGRVRVNGAHNQVAVPSSPFAQVCIRLTRTNATGVASAVTCVRSAGT